MIILTLAQARAVRGRSQSHPYASLRPIPLKDGTYMLPEEVLDDPAHSWLKEVMVGFPKSNVTADLRYGVYKSGDTFAQFEAQRVLEREELKNREF